MVTIIREACAKGTMDVFRFDLDGVTAEEVLRLVKRLEINLIDKEFKNVRITECDADEF